MVSRSAVFLATCAVLAALVVHATCDDSEKSESNSGFGDLLRSVGSSIQEGAKTVGSSIQEGAKKVGHTFQKGYDYVKKKVSEIGDDSKEDIAVSADIKKVEADIKKVEGQVADSVAKAKSDTSDIDGRFLFDMPQKCPPGETLDHSNHCRPV